MYLSLSRSQVSKKRVVQCSMGMRGARSGASSVWDRYLQGGGGKGLRRGKAADLPGPCSTALPHAGPQFPPPSKEEELTITSKDLWWAPNKGLLVHLIVS